jgi:hypothetical protein
MSSHYPFAKRAISILKFLARCWRIDISMDGETRKGNHVEDLYQPRADSTTLFRQGVGGMPSGIQQSPIFAPYFMQGLPIVSLDEVKLNNAGFCLST